MMAFRLSDLLVKHFESIHLVRHKDSGLLIYDYLRFVELLYR